MLPTLIILLTCNRFFSQIMASSVKPKVLVFDLDYTLWPFWVDTHVNPPFRKKSNGTVVDSTNATIKHYPEVPQVLNDLHGQGYVLAVASRTSEIQGAKQLVDLFGWKKYFSDLQIYPGVKTTHLAKKQFGVEYGEIIFFDDESRNIRDVSQLGVLSILVQNGVNKKVVDDALQRFSTEKS